MESRPQEVGALGAAPGRRSDGVWLKRGSLRAKLLPPMIGAGLVVGVVGAWATHRAFEQEFDEQISRRQEAIASAVNRAAEIAPGAAELQEFVASIGEMRDVTLIVVVTGTNPRVVASTRLEWIGRSLSELPHARVAEDLYDAVETRQVHRHYHDVTREYDISWPLVLANMGHDPANPTGADYEDGAVMLHLDARPVEESLARLSGEATVWLLGAVGVLTFLVFLLIDVTVLRRIEQISGAMNRRESGDSTAWAPDLGSDEVGDVARALNRMLGAVDAGERALQEANADLERRVAERTAALEESHRQLRTAERLASIGTLAAGVGHDLGNLLLPIRGRLRALDSAALSPEAREDVTAIRESVRFLGQLSDNLRLLAKDPDDPGVGPARTDLSEWWRQVGTLLRKAAPQEVELRAEFESGLPPVRLAQHRLTQAALNLVVNAADAVSGVEGPRIVVRAHRGEDGMIRLSVEDNGRGMAPGVAERAFDPFFTTRPRGTSTGLGLALVQRIAAVAGGSAEIESEVGKGTTITLRLPPAPEPGAAAPARRWAYVFLPEPALAAYAATLLVRAGYEVRHGAPGGAETPGTPGAGGRGDGAPVWVIDDSEESLRRVEAAQAAGSRARVLVVGTVDGGWDRVGATTVASPLDADSLGAALRTAASASGGDDDGR